MQAYLIKAAREAKLATAWMNPDEAYEQALSDFAADLLGKPPAHNAFLRDFIQLAEIVAYFGHLNSLAQTVLKLTLPGVPDLYQGTEMPLLALVDPDNRRAVKFDEAAHRLAQLQRRCNEPRLPLLSEMLTEWREGISKLYVTHQLLRLRSELPALFAEGTYQPLQVDGEYREHVFAFQRSWEQSTAIVVVARCMAKLMQGEIAAPLGAVWEDTVVRLSAPLAAGPRYELFSAESIELPAGIGELRMAEVLASFPIAVLLSKPL